MNELALLMSFMLFAFNALIWGIFGLWFAKQLFSSVQVVPTQTARIVERLGRYHRRLDAGFHFLMPWMDRVTYVHDLREQTIDVPPQQCFTLDNVRVVVDGVMYIQVVDPVKASYGVTRYRAAAMQLATTTSRAIIGTLELDKTFEERDLISAKVVEEVAKAGETWGIQVLRYEIKNIEPPSTVQNAMELQVTAERRRRAIIARSEGEMQARVNRSEGVRAELVARSAGERQRLINEAEGRASEILALAEATASSLEKVADAISVPMGEEAMRLRMSEAWLDKLAALAREQTRVVLPTDLASLPDVLRTLEMEAAAEPAPAGLEIPEPVKA